MFGRLRAIAAPAVVGALALAGCGSAGQATGGTSTVASSSSTAAAPTTTVPPTTTTTTEQPGWSPAATVGGAIAVDTQSVTEPTGHQVTVFRFRASRVRFGLHVGSTDPPHGTATVAADSGPAIGPDETAALVAAFNGGFASTAGAGGFELNGQVLVPLQTGMASLVIDTSGSARIGVWGTSVPVAGEQVASVRQNLAPLVVDGQPSPTVGDIGAWGATLGGGAAVARSSLAEDAAGDLLFAASMTALPADLADALVSAGAVTGMELDINPEWVQLAWSASPGGALTPGVPGQNRPADQYQVGWTRDFVTVLASG
jgi:hypothetical protein